MELQLHPRQAKAFQTPATEVLYGGAAGGGKSHFLRVSAIRWAMQVPGLQVYLFRRILPDLRDNHLRGPTSFHALLSELTASGHCHYRAQDNEFVFWNKSRIKLAHCQYEHNVMSYQGAEIHVLLMDELTHFTEYQYTFLRSRVRMAGIEVPNELKGLLPRIETGSNPGSVGHAWVKRTFVSPKAPEEVWTAPDEDGGMSRQYIPARLVDNPTLQEQDPMYMQRLEGLGTPELVRAMRDGDWDIIAGQALEKLNRKKHGIEPFDIPQHWTKFRSMDWGSSKPFSVGWWAVSDGSIGKIPKGALVRYREWYGWNGQDDIGLRLESDAVADRILELDGDDKLTPGPADPAMFAQHDGPSIAERMMARGVVWRKADNDRVSGYQELRSRIQGEDGIPMLYAFNTCQDGFWRTLPDLVMDERKPEDVDTTQEDHCYDEVRYACKSRPWTAVEMKKPRKDRWDRAFERTGETSWKIA